MYEIDKALARELAQYHKKAALKNDAVSGQKKLGIRKNSFIYGQVDGERRNTLNWLLFRIVHY